ncbi:hypothetical protein [Paramagnetospirillum magneticum]|uniref:LexA repressor DNA-binding domain-containing protein n=1 Tax=Paramagnetospirillum magneticum (strain ATCC 700264 / AMB-1) TaxID=342108 RepID=Q2W5Y7_PARM1|nr:hypothetical protein [Paramagnetospirillum magneticum]BAE50738.1 hypothetical protein amb1934 [Paramagnetospirillum magneticum AMB-1]
MTDRAAHLVKRLTILDRTNRLRVFAALKAWMEEYGECPTGMEIARATGLAPSTAVRHMKALNGAKGLPLSVAIRPFHASRLGVRLNDDKPVPVDEYEPVWVEVAE